MVEKAVEGALTDNRTEAAPAAAAAGKDTKIPNSPLD